MVTAFKVLTSLSEHSGPSAIDIPVIVNHVEVGALCLLKNKKSIISAMTDCQAAAFNLEKVDGQENFLSDHVFMNDYVVVKDDYLDEYLTYKSSSSFWGEYCHEDDLHASTNNGCFCPPQIIANTTISIPLGRQLESLSKYATYSRSTEKFLFLYHCLEIDFDRNIVRLIRGLDEQNPNELGVFISKLSNNEIERLKMVIDGFPVSRLDSHFFKLRNHHNAAKKIFYDYGKESNPIKELDDFERYIITSSAIDMATLHGIKVAHKISFELANPNKPEQYEIKMISLACYWIYRLRCCIAHNKLGEYHMVTGEDLEFLSDFGIPLIKDILEYRFASNSAI